ncbi:bola protein [Mycotypha africana]|uniref:bola protein n=1 Tax=Mycotypha africana TaxID=64632 RepID=UPI00230000C6|nr:bola protein [Mycotypha africana]KAI8975256.1 bola protein [Mycotypha africana]
MSSTSLTADTIKAAVIERLKDEVEDLSAGCGKMFEVVIVSNLFEGKRLLARHKLVNEALKEEISKVHAFTQKSYTPAEWEKKKAE